MAKSVVRVVERDESGRVYCSRIEGDGKVHTTVKERSNGRTTARHLDNTLEFLGKVFLPAGYPDSVSPDYLRYQVLNALQAFCSSLATLISNRAVLEGMGVGDASASATNALLLTVMQDVFSRLTTIIGAFYFGSSLYPEAKLYRILADVLNDAAIVLDTVSPILVFDPSSSSRFNFPGIRVAALCLSSAFRSLCGIAAGGSKAAITLHFASPVAGKGDVGDLNAKDASKETVLALSGMLMGTLVVPYLTTAWTIYPVLFFLLLLHLLINFMGVRGLVLRSLNRQRATLTWLTFSYSHADTSKKKILSPAEIAHRERIFDTPGVLRDPLTGRILGQCDIGSASLGKTSGVALRWHSPNEKYVIAAAQTPNHQPSHPLHLHILLKDGHSTRDHLKAWAHASETAMQWSVGKGKLDPDEMSMVLSRAYSRVDESWDVWIDGLKTAGWNLEEASIVAGAPNTVILELLEG